jgi:hypothetical protein
LIKTLRNLNNDSFPLASFALMACGKSNMLSPRVYNECETSFLQYLQQPTQTSTRFDVLRLFQTFIRSQ